MADKSPRTAAPAAAGSPDAAAASGVVRRPLWRRLLRAGVWSLVGLLLLAAGLAFLASRTVTLQWATQQIVRLADGRLTVEGVAGSVLTGISADYLQWQDGALTVSIASPRFTYHPFAMLDGLARIESISAGNVEIDLPSSTGSGQPRQSFRLPAALASMLPVSIERVELGRLVVRHGGRPVADLRDLELSLRHDGDRISARLHNLTVIAGGSRIGLSGDAAVLARAPYATDGRLAVRLPMRPQPVRLDVRINGPVEELSVRAGTVLAGATVDARTIVHTLEPRPLRQVRVEVKDLDLSRHDPSLPVTSLAGSYVAEVMPVWASERRPLLIGPVNLTNALAAPLDLNRLPVAQVKAVVGYVDGGLQLQGLQASGPVGEVTGEGWVGPGSVKLVFASDSLQLRALHRSLPYRTLNARIALERVGKSGLGIDASAADAALTAELKAVMRAGRQLQISRAQLQFQDERASGAGEASLLGTVGLAAPWPLDLSGVLRNLVPPQLAATPPALLNGSWRLSGQMAGNDGAGLIQAYLSLDSGTGMHLSRVQAVVEGSPADHRVEVVAAGAGKRLEVKAQGAYDNGMWRGVVDQLAASHPLLEMPGADGNAATASDSGAGQAGLAHPAIRSSQPFNLVAEVGRVAASNARFDFHGARLNLQLAEWQGPMLRLSADASGLAGRWLARFLPAGALPQETAQDLTLAAAVEFAGNLEHADGAGWRAAIRLQRERGDLALSGPGAPAPLPAGLKTLEASLSIEDRTVDLVVNFDGEHVGRMAIEARTRLQNGSAQAWTAASIAASPLAGRLDLAVNSFGWIPRIAEESWLVDGALSARLQLAGTLGNPRVQGSVTGSNLSAENRTLGMRLRNGVLAAELAGDRIDVRLLRFESGAGSVAVSGLLQNAGEGRSQSRVVLDRLPILLGPGERVVLSGSTTASLADRTLDVSGRLVVEEGLVEVVGKSPAEAIGVGGPDSGGSGFPDHDEAADAAARRVADRSGRTSGAATRQASRDAGRARARGFGIDTDVEVDLGRRFRVVGSGLDVNLRGAIRLRGHYPVATHASGTIELAGGNYRVHGRQLRIERGRIVFDGLLDDPALDIVAVRDNLKVEPGVWIGGSAASPVARLVSTPAVPDADKLAWLVLGGSLAGTKGVGQQRALQRAAAVLFGDEAAAVAGLDGTFPTGAPSIQTREAGAPGGGAAYSPGALATVGSQLGSRLSETYGQSLRGVWNILKLQYEITDRLSLAVQAGSDRAAELFRLVPED